MFTAHNMHQNSAIIMRAAAWCHIDIKQAGAKGNTKYSVWFEFFIFNFSWFHVTTSEGSQTAFSYFFFPCEKTEEAFKLQSLPLLTWQL